MACSGNISFIKSSTEIYSTLRFLQQKLRVATVEQKYEIIKASVAQAFPPVFNRFGAFLVQTRRLKDPKIILPDKARSPMHSGTEARGRTRPRSPAKCSIADLSYQSLERPN